MCLCQPAACAWPGRRDAGGFGVDGTGWVCHLAVLAGRSPAARLRARRRLS